MSLLISVKLDSASAVQLKFRSVESLRVIRNGTAKSGINLLYHDARPRKDLRELVSCGARMQLYHGSLGGAAFDDMLRQGRL